MNSYRYLTGSERLCYARAYLATAPLLFRPCPSSLALRARKVGCVMVLILLSEPEGELLGNEYPNGRACSTAIGAEDA